MLVGLSSRSFVCLLTNLKLVVSSLLRVFFYLEEDSSYEKNRKTNKKTVVNFLAVYSASKLILTSLRLNAMTSALSTHVVTKVSIGFIVQITDTHWLISV